MKSLQTFSIRRHRVVFWGGLILATVLVATISLWTGSVQLSPQEILRVFCGQDTTSTTAKIILYTRLPRVCAAMLSGAALSVAGAVIQTVLQNPLASPGIIGVNSSAGLAVACVCAIAPSAQRFTPFIAFAGAFIGVMLVMILAEKTGASRMTVVLAGVAVSNLFSAGIDAVVTLVPEALTGVTDFRIGGFTGVTMEQLRPAAVLILVSLFLVCSLAQQLDILALGTEVAHSLGLSVKMMRVVFLLLAATLAGAAVSFAGLLSFVGLVVPHIMRQIQGETSDSFLLSSAIGGALFVMLCDLLARVLFAPFELPVGIVLAFTGAPFFLWMLLKKGGHA